MVALVIFGAAVLAMLFFVLGIVFKALLSVFITFLMTIEQIFKYTAIIGVIAIALQLVCDIADAYMTNQMGTLISSTVTLMIEVIIVIVFVGKLGMIIVNFVLYIIYTIEIFIANILDKASEICEVNYRRYLMVINKNIERC